MILAGEHFGEYNDTREMLMRVKLSERTETVIEKRGSRGIGKGGGVHA
jgi:hypothetical protein